MYPSTQASELRAPGAALDEPATVEPVGQGEPRLRSPLRDRWPVSSAALALLLSVVLAIPLAVAVGVLRQPQWYPLSDIAQTELRVRDVWSAHPPLTGLGGRIGVFGPDQGSHPGPLSFWTLSVFYRLFGSGSWALQAATACLNAIAIGSILWVARRRGGAALTLGMAATVAVLTHSFGAAALTEAWNPYLPIVWWVVFLLAVWSVLCGDLPMLPLAVFAGSFCMQTHISYVGLVTGLGAIGFASAGWAVFSRRHRPNARSSLLWLVGGAVTGVVLWVPPIVDQLRNRPGNLSKIYDYFATPPEDTLGLGDGFDRLLIHLNPWTLLTREVAKARFAEGSAVPGLFLLGAWAIAAVVAWRLRHRLLVRVHLLLVAALGLAALSTSRIFGPTWYYLTLWAWGINALLVLSIGWTLCVALDRSLRGVLRERVAWAGALLAIGVVLVSTFAFTDDAAHVEVFEPELSEALDTVVPETLQALEGEAGPYLVSWSDPAHLGARGFALFNELDRHGIDVRADEFWREAITHHRVIDPADASEEIHLAVGPDIDPWRTKAGFRQVAYFDPVGKEERAEINRLRLLVIDELNRSDLSDLVANVDAAPTAFVFEVRVSQVVRDRMARIVEAGQPTAVVIGPPTRRDDPRADSDHVLGSAVVLWFERQVVGALTEGLDHEKQDAIAAYVGGALGALPDHIRLGVGAQSVALGAWARGRAILGAGAGSSVDVGSFEVSRLAPVRQYVRALRSLVLFAEHELTPGAGG